MRSVLSEATAAWRKTRHPRWAGVTAAAAAQSLAQEPARPVVGAGRKQSDTEAWEELAKKNDPLDLARLMAANRATSAAEAAARVKALATREDPRLIDEVLAVLESPPWRANVFKDFVRTAIEVFVSARDVRAREAMKDLAPRYKAIIETSVGDWVSTQLARAAQAMSGVEPTPLSAADEKRLAELEQRLSVRAVKKSARSDAELLATIYAAPDDDGPRLVFADALSERGDPRGEFISLQVQRFRGHGTTEQLARERELHGDPKRLAAWALPLANGGTFTFERGFPVAVTLKPASAKKVLGEPAWATVRSVAGLEKLSGKLALEFLEHPAMAHVREVGVLTTLVGAGLSTRPRAWTAVAAHFLPSKELISSWAALERLTLWPIDTPALATGLFEPLPHLRELNLGMGVTFAPGALASARGLVRLTLTLPFEKELAVPAELLQPLVRLKALELVATRNLNTALLAACAPLDELSLMAHALTADDVRAALKLQPALTQLSLGRSPHWASLDAVLELIEGTAVKRVSADADGVPWGFEEGTVMLSFMPRNPEHVFARALEQRLVKRVRVVKNRHASPLDVIDPRVVDSATQYFGERGVPVET